MKTASNVWPQAGMVVSIPIFLIYRHKGIVSDRWHGGKPMIISNSARSHGVCEEPWDAFAEGNIVKVDGYLGGLPNYEVLNRARLLIGTQYNLFDWNCEHYVTHAHGLKQQRLQIAVTLTVAVLCVGMLAVTK